MGFYISSIINPDRIMLQMELVHEGNRGRSKPDGCISWKQMKSEKISLNGGEKFWKIAVAMTTIQIAGQVTRRRGSHKSDQDGCVYAQYKSVHIWWIYTVYNDTYYTRTDTTNNVTFWAQPFVRLCRSVLQGLQMRVEDEDRGIYLYVCITHWYYR